LFPPRHHNHLSDKGPVALFGGVLCFVISATHILTHGDGLFCATHWR